MDEFREKQMLRLAREMATSHGTLFAAALLADVGVPLPLALAALTRSPHAMDSMAAGDSRAPDVGLEPWIEDMIAMSS